VCSQFTTTFEISTDEGRFVLLLNFYPHPSVCFVGCVLLSELIPFAHVLTHVRICQRFKRISSAENLYDRQI